MLKRFGKFCSVSEVDVSDSYQKLNTDRLAEIFKDRVTKPQCPFCEHDDWALPQLSGSSGVMLPWAYGENFALTGPSAVMLYCKNCGFMRLHALDALDGVLEDTGINADLIEVGPKREDA